MSALFVEAMSTGVYAALRTWFYLWLLSMALEVLGKTENWVPKISDTSNLRIAYSLFTGLLAAAAFVLAKPAIDYIVASGILGAVTTGLLAIAIAHAVEWVTFLLYLRLFNRQLVTIRFWKAHGSSLRQAIAAHKTALLDRCKQYLRHRMRGH